VLNIITAYKSEATPIIDALNLSPFSGNGQFPLYTRPGIRLGISGMGCHNAQRLVRYLQDSPGCKIETETWINFGIAGSADWEPGELVLAESVIDQSSGEKWILKHVVALNLPRACLCTVKSPQNDYDNNRVYDMEAAGIVSLLSDSKCCHSLVILKLISDGPENPVGKLTQNAIRKLIQTKKDDIIAAIQSICTAFTVCPETP